MTLMQFIPGPARSIACQTPQRIAIVTDAWHPQMNGVVRTLSTTCEQLREDGHEVMVVSPDQFASIPCPTWMIQSIVEKTLCICYESASAHLWVFRLEILQTHEKELPAAFASTFLLN